MYISMLGMKTVKMNQGEHRHETPSQAYEKNRHMLEALFDTPPTLAEVESLMQPDYEVGSLEEIFRIVEEIES